VAIAIGAAWVIWQPLRSSDADAEAVTALLRGDTRAALDNAHSAVSADPVSADALWVLSEIEHAVGNRDAARKALVQATTRQPSNPETWQRLGEFDIRYHELQLALNELDTAAQLDLTAVQPLWDLAAAYTSLQNAGAARAELAMAIKRQPRSPDTWQHLGVYDLRNHSPQTALPELGAANSLGGLPQTTALIAKAQTELNASHARAAAAAKAAAHRRHGR
jgi:tetratricopeptide (TPR) repeat protein